MNNAAYVDEVRDHVRALEARAARRGLSQTDARRRIADKLGCAPGTLESIAKGRKKSIDAGFWQRVRNLLVKEIEREIKALTHELEILRQTGADPDPIEITEVEAHLAKVRTMLAGASGRAVK